MVAGYWVLGVRGRPLRDTRALQCWGASSAPGWWVGGLPRLGCVGPFVRGAQGFMTGAEQKICNGTIDCLNRTGPIMH